MQMIAIEVVSYILTNCT